MTWIWTDPPDSTPTRWMKSATGGASDGPEGVLAIRSTTGLPAAPVPPALSAPAEALQPAAAATARASASSVPALPGLMSGSGQGDVKPKDGPVHCEREVLAVGAKDGRHE